MRFSPRFTKVLCLAFLLGSGAALAAEKPDVVRHDARYLERALTVNVEWQSSYPVRMVRIYAGKTVKVIPVEEDANSRNPTGYQGEVSEVLSVEPGALETSVSYVIQLEDELKQKSALVNGKAPLPVAAATPSQQLQQASDDQWGKESVRAGQGKGQLQQENRGGIVDKLLAVADRFTFPPSLEELKVHAFNRGSVSFATKASHGNGLQEVWFKVYDAGGNLVGYQSITKLGKVWQGSSQTFALGGGTFRVVAQAIDVAGNLSREQVVPLTLEGDPISLQPLPEPAPSVAVPQPQGSAKLVVPAAAQQTPAVEGQAAQTTQQPQAPAPLAQEAAPAPATPTPQPPASEPPLVVKGL